MDQEVVHRLEQDIARAIFDVIEQKSATGFPYVPSHRTMHLMAKAAVSVYEAVAEYENAEE